MHTYLIKFTLNLGKTSVSCLPKKMQKVSIFGEDNTEVRYENKEEDDGESGFKLGNPYYVEFSLEKGKDMAIQLESDSSKYLFHNATSRLLNINDGKCETTKSLNEGVFVLLLLK